MKKLILFAFLALVSVFAASAVSFLDCSDMTACINQNDDLSCVPSDTECSYTLYTEDTGSCVIDTGFVDSDFDTDNWTDGCDAFIVDRLEWFDLDADGVGHNYDCDDFDPSIKYDCDWDNDNYTNDEEHDNGTDPNEFDPHDDNETNETDTEGNETDTNQTSNETTSVSGGGTRCVDEWECTEWTECDEEYEKTRTCVKVNENCRYDDHKPAEIELCPRYETLSTTKKNPSAQIIEPSPVTGEENKTAPEDNSDDGLSGITGKVTGGFFGGKFTPWFFLILGILIFFLIFRRRKERKEKPEFEVH